MAEYSTDIYSLRFDKLHVSALIICGALQGAGGGVLKGSDPAGAGGEQGAAGRESGSHCVKKITKNVLECVFSRRIWGYFGRKIRIREA